MMEFKILGDQTTKTPKGVGLCLTCQYSHIFGSSPRSGRVFCKANSYVPGGCVIEITKPVEFCSDYLDRALRSQMEYGRIGWVLIDDGHGHKKFLPPKASESE